MLYKYVSRVRVMNRFYENLINKLLRYVQLYAIKYFLLYLYTCTTTILYFHIIKYNDIHVYINNVATLSSTRKNELKQNKFNITQHNTI